MKETYTVANTTVRLVKGDITDEPVEAFVYYAQHDLKLGSGFGTAIAGRGGLAFQKECDALAPLETGDAVVTGAGAMKADKIVHAVGPRFLESDLEGKLRKTMRNVFRVAREAGVKRLAFPPMGAGFYGVPLDVSARVMTDEIKRYATEHGDLDEIAIFVVDKREFTPFQAELQAQLLAAV